MSFSQHLMFSPSCVQALSPVRFLSESPAASPPPPTPPPHTVSLSPEGRHFLKGSHGVLLCPPPPVTEQHDSESWPSTDQSSSPASTDVQHPQHAVTGQAQEPSVLAKYEI